MVAMLPIRLPLLYVPQSHLRYKSFRNLVVHQISLFGRIWSRVLQRLKEGVLQSGAITLIGVNYMQPIGSASSHSFPNLLPWACRDWFFWPAHYGWSGRAQRRCSKCCGLTLAMIQACKGNKYCLRWGSHFLGSSRWTFKRQKWPPE